MSALSPARSPASILELIACLEEPVRREYASPIAALRRAPSRYATSFAIDDLSIELEDGRVVEAVFKDLSPDALLDGARRSRPPGVFDPAREIEIYRSVLRECGTGTPRLIASRVDPERGLYWLVLERVDGVELYQVGDLAVWQSAARWLRSFHDWAANGRHLPQSLPHLGPSWYRMWMKRAVAFAPPPARPLLTRLAAVHEAVVDGLCRLPATVIHGDFYASNVLATSHGRHRVCPVDWERAAVGPGLLDLASLVTGWGPEGAEAIVEAYGAVDRHALDLCRLQVCVQWLGWSAGWDPPLEHRQDWLAEAGRLGKRLGLL